jgi:branched-chain amino acid transport system substrate-binding protein
MQKLVRTVVPALSVFLLVVGLAACGNTPASNLKGGTVCIGTEFPTTGTDGSEGQPAENGVDLAVKQNSDLGSGFKLEVRNFNDVAPTTGLHDPPTGAQNVQQMLTTTCILAFVGPFNSGVAGAEIPVAASAGLAMISPANTNPGLTLSQYSTQYGFNYDNLHPAGKPNVYFRIPANDVTQGKVDADYALNTLNAKNVYVVDDTEAYGKGLADFFELEFKAKGGNDLGRDEISAKNASQLPALAAKIVAAKPDAVFYGGVTSEGGGLLKAQLVQAGFTGPMVGGDGIAEDSAFLTQAGSAANDTHGTVAAPDLSTFTAGAQLKFVNDYKAQFNADPGPYSANSYDAAMIEITAIKNLIKAGTQPTRSTVLSAIAGIHYTGVTGQISFDEHGDNAGNKVFSIYKVDAGKWVFVTSVTA